ncbi:MAG: hypothetical protein KGY42_00925 [Desulfobacterales bacterium]|nr:hypothetical protein [Desulfobacterales bacterium]MBS3755657.1 hypothetical protein [Desulfobacterales bacterium]
MGKSQPDIKPLIDYFLNLFTIQTLGPGKEPETVKAEPVSGQPSEGSVYEFTLKSGSTKKQRRMSLEPIGAGVGSKSMCYKVIYDEPLVIKIPPKPIPDFSAYLKSIQREHQIVERLSPEIACVFPRLEAILKKVPFLKFSEERFTPEEIENAYINLLLRKPGLQQYLKIGNKFVFFMNLSRHQFFNQVIESMHIVKDRVREDMIKNMSEVLPDPDAFGWLYGEENYPVYLSLRGLFAEYEASLENLAEKYEINSFIPEYRRREWFFSALAGAQPEIEAGDIPGQFPAELQEQTTRLLAANKQTTAKIYRTVYKRVQRQNFDTNRSRIKGMVINILQLLYQLKGRNLALRDLKPDNMYIDRYLDAADHILADPSLYGLGLIDLETAVCFDPEIELQQPLLAGTPAYATPAHLFPNDILRKLYPEQIDRVFYMQDWYAVIGIIFHVITGRVLFTKTARLMPEIIQAKRHASRNNGDFKKIYKNISGKFWASAIEEFKEKTSQQQQRLETLEVFLPAHIKNLFEKAAAREQQRAHKAIKSWLKKDEVLRRYRKALMGASYAVVAHNLEKWRANGRTSDATLHALSRIARYKFREEYLSNSIRELSGPVPADFLLSFIFDRVFYTMYRRRWSPSQPRLVSPGLQNAQAAHNSS